MDEKAPRVRKDLEFLPVEVGGQHMILIRDHLGLVKEGQGIAPHLYQFMTLLDGTKTVRDLQLALMRLKGGVLVGSDEVQHLLSRLDGSFLLDSDTFTTARDEIVAAFTSSRVRPCSECGRAYADDPSVLTERLDEILTSQPSLPKPPGKIKALVAPHIDLSAGLEVYSSGYQMLKDASPARVLVLGVGHRITNALFCVTQKDFETPLGIVKNEPYIIQELQEAGGDITTPDDFAHRSEHSIEFQVLFLQHLLSTDTFTIIPVLCGSLDSLPAYKRDAYLKKADPFLQKLREIITASDKETLVVAGVDFSHVGPKFGHERPADYMESEATRHDKNLLKHLSQLDAEHFWEESINVEDRFNVCGFPAMACLLEILPACNGKVLNYKFRHEEATRSAVSFAAAVFTS